MAFVDGCVREKVHPSAARYEAWAEQDERYSMYEVVRVFGSWNAALTGCGFEGVKRSPNPRARRLN